MVAQLACKFLSYHCLCSSTMIGVRSCFLLPEIGIGVETGPGDHQGSSRAWLIPNGNCSAYRIPLLCGEQDCPARKGEGKKQDLTPSTLGKSFRPKGSCPLASARNPPASREYPGFQLELTRFHSSISSPTSFRLPIMMKLSSSASAVIEGASIPVHVAATNCCILNPSTRSRVICGSQKRHV